MNEYKSQSKQDLIVDRLLKKQKNGCFVDIGANDGISFSNSFFFENTRNWNGICIEPVPRFYTQLIKNRNCITVNACIADEENTVEFIEVSGPSEMLSGIKSQKTEEHFIRIQNAIKLDGGSYSISKLNVVRLDSILIENKISKIDLMSIDTEGYELTIIKSINFDEYDINMLTIENDQRKNEIRNYLKHKGYLSLCFSGPDEIFCKRKEIRLSKYFFYYYIKGIIQKTIIILK